MGFRIVLDEVLCQGHAVCESEAPGIFEVPKGGPVRIVDPTPGEARRAEVQAAVRYCPTHALSIVEDEPA